MLRTLLLSFSLALSLLSCAQYNIGDTVFIQKWADSVTVHRVDTFAAAGLIHSTCYYPDGRVYSSGMLTTENRPYDERLTGEWIYLDTSGALSRRQFYRNGKWLIYCWHHDSVVDSSLWTGLHRHDHYQYTNGHLRVYSKSRAQWVSAAYRRMIFNMGIVSEYRGAEWQKLEERNYDTLGRLTSSVKYHRDHERRIMTITDSSTTTQKFTLHRHPLLTVKRDTNNTILARTRFRRFPNRRKNYYHPVKYEKQYYSNGRLKYKRTDRRLVNKTIRRNENGQRNIRTRDGLFFRSTKKWTDFGHRRMVEREFHGFFINYYVRKTWDETTHKKSVTHRRPPRVW